MSSCVWWLTSFATARRRAPVTNLVQLLQQREIAARVTAPSRRQGGRWHIQFSSCDGVRTLQRLRRLRTMLAADGRKHVSRGRQAEQHPARDLRKTRNAPNIIIII